MTRNEAVEKLVAEVGVIGLDLSCRKISSSMRDVYMHTPTLVYKA